MADINEIKKRIMQIGIKLKSGLESYVGSRIYEKLAYGIEVVENARRLAENLSSEVEKGDKAVRGALSIARKNRNEQKEGDEKDLEDLRRIYDGRRKGFFKKALAKVTRKKYPSLKEVLEIIGDISEKIPDYVTKLSEELSYRREELGEFKTDLRNKIEDLISNRKPVEEEIGELENVIKEVEEEYKGLEEQRLDNSSKGIQSHSDLIYRLGMLESTIGQAKDKYSELDVQKKQIQSNIELINNQIGKLGQLLELLHKTQDVTYLAKDFIEIQVPYVISEIRTQGSQIHSLSGVDRAVEFLDAQTKVSGSINQRIKFAVEYLGRRVNEVREEITKNNSIYIKSSRVQVIDTEKRGLQRYLTNSSKDYTKK